MTTAPLSLEHIIRPAAPSNNKPPVLFMLHGYGSNEDDLFSFAQELPQELCIISVRAPYPLQPYGHAWYAIHFEADNTKWSDDGQAIRSRDLLRHFILEACSTYGLDQDQVTLLGFSQGTILSYALALSYPTLVKNVIALSGYINEGILKEGYEEHDFSGLGIYASHGQVDQVIPVAWAQRAPVLLERLNIDHVYEEFPAGHGVVPQNFHAFKNWLIGRL